MIVSNSAKAALLLLLGGLYLVITGVADFRVGRQARAGATPAPCDGPVTSEYIELRECHVDYRDAVPIHGKDGLARAFVPIRSAAGVETGIVLGIGRDEPNFGMVRILADPFNRSKVPESRAVVSLTIRASKQDTDLSSKTHYALLAAGVREDYQVIRQVVGPPPTPWLAILKVSGGVICLLCGVIAGIGFVAWLMAEARKLDHDQSREP